MYRRLIRPLLFLLPPEAAHRFALRLLRLMGALPGMRRLVDRCFTLRHPALEREVFGIRFRNPVGMAAGFDKNAEAYDPVAALGFGFVEVGTLTPRPQPGNPRPRLFRLPADRAFINRMGINNAGVDYALRRLRRPGRHTVVGANIGKNTLTPTEGAAADYLQLFRRLYQYVDLFVLNISCPNVQDLASLQECRRTEELLEPLFAFRRGQSTYRPILLKISSDLSDQQVDAMTDLMISSALDGIVAVNTTTRRDGVATRPETLERIGQGGLSGAPLTRRAVEVVRRIHTRSQGRYPIIGVGGILCVEDALAMFDAGASLIELYTGIIYEGPFLPRRICRALIERAGQRDKPTSCTHESSPSATKS